MSLFNKLTYYMLWVEVALYLASLLPLSFLTAKTRRDGMNWIVKITSNEYAIWTCRIILMIIAGVFADNVLRLLRLDGENHDSNAHHHNHHSGAEFAYDLQSKYQRFYSQRNVYMSAFTNYLHFASVLYRRFLDMYRITQLELDVSATKQSPPVPIPLVPIASKTASTSATATSATATSAMKSKDGVATVNKPKAE